MNREWSISRQESQILIDLRLLSKSKFENVIAREYEDGVNKFFEANNLPPVRSVFFTHTYSPQCRPRFGNVPADLS